MITPSARCSSLLVLTSIVSSTALSAGFALNEQSARALGQAFSGRASDADTAGTVSANPAGMSRLTQAEISAGFAVIDAHSDIKDATSSFSGAPISGSNDGDMVPLIAIPFGFYVQPLDEHWAVGFGVYAPFGLTTDYEHDFQGRYFGTKSEVQNIAMQPTVSYKFDNGISLGAGITYNLISGNLDENIPNPLDHSSDVVGKVDGDDTGWGYNLGILYEFNNNKTRIGLTYYSKVDYTLEGHTKVTNIPSALGLGSSQRYKASLDITTPDKVDFSFTHALTPELTLHGDVTQTRWNKLSELRVENENAPTAPVDLSSSTEALDWDNSWFYSLGLSYQLDQQWLLRGGVAIDKSPIPTSTRSVRVPTSDRTMFAIGTTWAPVNNLSVDLAYMYFVEKTASVDRSGEILGATYSYSAEYENYANILAAQVNWRF
ncbi:MAG TPA: OmpP1/FadL family transporter [Spongiibacteraceae bacterium]|nr:OmpP1/FadL family transporter [Spongiibacteraceae bacterium]